MGSPDPIQFMLTDKYMSLLYEQNSWFKVFPVDGRPHPDKEPSWFGDSVGHWEGDTLVSDTIGIKTSVSVYRGIPHSNQVHITERFRLLAPDILHDQITIEDPVMLEKPLTYTVAYKRMQKDYEMVEFVCDNNREYVDDKGIVRMKVENK
jgi:hypothetical protein